ncbi:MAG: AGE family epimerase/isomerase [Bacteroidales bacterium]
MDNNLLSIGAVLRSEASAELTNDILPFWIHNMEDPAGGWYGRMDGSGRIVPCAPKGAILNSRILWTFSSAYRLLGSEGCLKGAERAFREIADKFYDKDFGGVFWSIDSSGRPLETKKQFYAIAFAIYGLSEFYRASGSKPALDLAAELFDSIEKHSRDYSKGGYLEASSRDWSPIGDMRLSDKDRNDAKTMNTHLHILEGYTALYRVRPSVGLKACLLDLIDIFLDRIIRPDGHLGLFFDEDWKSQSDVFSYGHDIEASWLLCEAAKVLEDKSVIDRVEEASSALASAAIEGWSPGEGMKNEYDSESDHVDADRDWWVQAETVVGCWNRFRISGDVKWAERSVDTWRFIRSSLVCPAGEWYWSLRADGTPDLTEDRAGFWKCPYHNGRMCMELIERI